MGIREPRSLRAAENSACRSVTDLAPGRGFGAGDQQREVVCRAKTGEEAFQFAKHR